MLVTVWMQCPVCARMHSVGPVDDDGHEAWREGRLPLSIALPDVDPQTRDRLVDELCPDHAGDAA